MSTWPATLPQNAFVGASIQDDESRLTSQMDSGPAAVRNRFTAISKTLTTTIVLTGAQLNTFNNFLRNTLSNGAEVFDWTDPEDDTTVSMRFRQKPQWTCIKPSSDPNARMWSGALTLEILP